MRRPDFVAPVAVSVVAILGSCSSAEELGSELRVGEQFDSIVEGQPSFVCADSESDSPQSGVYCYDLRGIGVRGLLKLARDLDGDRHIDLAVVDGAHRTLSVLFGDGLGGFSDPQTIQLPARIFTGEYLDPTFFAFDEGADEILELGMTFVNSKELWVITQTEPRVWSVTTRPVIHPGALAVLPFDADDDGDDDLILGAGVGTETARIEHLQTQPEREHEYQADYTAGPWPMLTAFARLGSEQLFAVGTWAGIREASPVHRVDVAGGLTLSDTPVFMAGADPYWLHTGDVDGDGLPELIAGNRGSGDFSVSTQSAAGTFSTPLTVTVLQTPECATQGCMAMTGSAVGDLDGDGTTELLATMSRDAAGGAHLYVVDELTSDSPKLELLAVDAHEPITADFNEDGVDDVVFSHPQGVQALISTP